MRHVMPVFAVALLAAVILLGGIGPSRAQDAGIGTPAPDACATPGAVGSPDATPVLVIDATPGVDPGEATPTVEVVCATFEAATPGA